MSPKWFILKVGPGWLELQALKLHKTLQGQVWTCQFYYIGMFLISVLFFRQIYEKNQRKRNLGKILLRRHGERDKVLN